MQGQTEHRIVRKDLNRMYERVQEFLTEVIVNIGIARGEHYRIEGVVKYARKALSDARKQIALLDREIEGLLAAYDYYKET